MTTCIRARHYATGQAVEVHCDRSLITAIAPATGTLARGWVAPAFFDLQINGCDGHSFNSEKLTVAAVRHVVDVCRRHGIGSLCPTLVTNSFAGLARGASTIREACAADPTLAAAIPAIHLEGPYISGVDGPRGAHPRQHVRPPDWDEFRRLQDAAGGMIRLVTLAPEHEGAIHFIARLVAAGVVVALGHTAATGRQIHEAIAAGARLSTHLGNGSHALLPRHENYVWEQLAADELWASFIFDGHHLPAAVMRCLLRVKTPARSILTCDASSLAGSPPGTYVEWDQKLEVLPGGKIIVAGTTYLAGSGSFTDLCVGNAMRYAGASLVDAVDMAGARPRELLRLPPRPLEVGAAADLVLFDWEPGADLRVRQTIVGGEIVFSALGNGS